MTRKRHSTTRSPQNAALLNVAEGRAERYASIAAASGANALVRAAYPDPARRARVWAALDRVLDGRDAPARDALYAKLAAAMRLKLFPEMARLRHLVVLVCHLAGDQAPALLAEAKAADTHEEAMHLLDQAVNRLRNPQPTIAAGDAPRRWFLARVVNPAPIDTPAIRRGWEYPVHRSNGVYWIINPDANTGTILSADVAARALRSVRTPAGAPVYVSEKTARAADETAFVLGFG